MFNRTSKLIFSLFIISLLFIPFVSAFAFSDFWNKLTGKAIVNLTYDGAPFEYSCNDKIGRASCRERVCLYV